MLLDESALLAAGQAQHSPVQLEPAYAQFRDQTRFWIQRVAVPMIMVVGLFGNLITVIIMTRRRMRSTTNMYLAALAFVDMLYLVLTFLLGLSHYPNVARRRYYLYWRLKPFLMMLTDSCSNTSVWLTVTFTIERFIAVRYPIKGKVWCTEARAKRLIVCVFLAAILYTLPTPFEWNVVERRLAASSSRKQPEASANFNNLNGDFVSKVPPFASPEAKHLMPSLTGLPVDEQPAEEPISVAATDDDDDDDDDDELVIMALEYSDFGSNETYKTIYYWSTAAIFYFIPLLLLTLFNGFLIHSVHRSRRERNKMTNQRGAANSTGLDRDRPPPTHTTPHSPLSATAAHHRSPNTLANNKNSSRLKRGGNSPIVASDTFPEVKFEVIGELAKNQDDSLRAALSTQNLDGETLDNQQTDCDKHDSNPSSRAFVRAPTSELPVTSPVSRLNCGHKRSPIASLASTRSEPLIESARDQRGTASEDAITRLHLVGTDKTDALRAGLLEVNIAEQSARAAGSASSGCGPASPRSQLISLDSSLTNNNHSPCSSGYNEPATPVQQSNTMAPASSQERRITIMLISVVILFLVCQIPTAAMLLYTSVHETIPNTNEQALQLALGNIFNFLMAVNAAGNFILYSFLSKKYRRTFVILFCRCLRRKQPKRRTENHSTRTKSSCCLSRETGKNSTAINTSSSIVDELPSTKRWASVRFSKLPKPPASLDTKRILIKDSKDTGPNHSTEVAERKRRDTLV